jgi:acetylornithine deacetylase/succinyl-diaminopimelate desuccinylase-like protein
MTTTQDTKWITAEKQLMDAKLTLKGEARMSAPKNQRDALRALDEAIELVGRMAAQERSINRARELMPEIFS